MTKSRLILPFLPAFAALTFTALAVSLAAPDARASLPMPAALAPVAAQALPAVVSVESIDPMKHAPQQGAEPTSTRSEPADTNPLIVPPPAEQALGTGFLIGKDGTIVTNHHVIAGASEIRVTLNDGRVYPAKLVGADAKSDLAVLKINVGHDLAFLKFGDSLKLADGDVVMAIGNPFGLSFSVSAGIVSALHRNIGSGPYDDFIQTDAAINRGNSGGPLLDQKGEVVGIDTAIYSPAGGSVGIGFAIPSSTIRPIVAALRAHGRMVRGWTGLRIEQVSDEMARAWKLASTDGVVVAGVAGDGPSAGLLQPGDVILRIGAQTITDTQSFKVAVGVLPRGDQVPMVYWRDGTIRHASLMTAKPPQDAEPKAKPIARKAAPTEIAALGMTVAAHPKASGIVIVGVKKDGPAAKAGLGKQALIEAVGPDFVATPGALQKALARQDTGKGGFVTLLIERPEGLSWVPVRLPPQLHAERQPGRPS